MSKGRLLIIGAGGHGKVAGDCARALGQWREIIFFDDKWPGRQSCGPWPVKGRAEDILSAALPGDQAFVAIGHCPSRMVWLRRLQEANIPVATIVHPSAVVSPDSVIGEGSLVVAGAVINIDSRLGHGCIINTGATVDHDCLLADGVHLCPGANLAGGVTVGAESWVGIGSSVLQGISIGSGVTVGAGAAVIRDVANGLTVAGVPAREIHTSVKR